MSRQNISMGTILRQMVLFDIQSGYKTDKGITEIVSLPVLFEESKQAVLFKAALIGQLEKVFKFEFEFYNQIIKTLMKTQPFFLECQKKVQAAKTQEEKEKVLYESNYVSIYTKTMSNIVLETIPQPELKKFDLKKEKIPAKKEILKQFNDATSEIVGDFQVHIACIKTQQDFVNQVMIHNSQISFSGKFGELTYCNSLVAACNFFDGNLDLATYAKTEYKAKYDEKKLASDFSVKTVEKMHADMLKLLGIAAKQFSHQQQRHEKTKELV